MSTSLRENGPSDIAEWFAGHEYPHCQRTTNLASLRSGVAIAEVMAEKLPMSVQGSFLARVEISDLTPQRCMENLTVLVQTLKGWMGGMDYFTPQGLYFDHNMMETFVREVVMKLESGAVPEVQPEDIHDIANLSSIIASQEHKPYSMPQMTASIRPQPPVQQEETKQTGENLLERWLRQTHRLSVQLPPHELFGRLINSVFAGGRLHSNLIIKPSHYAQGPVAVFRKACDYLMSCERMPKNNVLQLAAQVEQGNIEEQLFWTVLRDIKQLKKIPKVVMRRSESKRKTKRLKSTANQSEKENMRGRTETSSVKEKRQWVLQEKQRARAEQWISDDLGYSHSLNRSKAFGGSIVNNPLLNGVLLGSVVMRMGLGRLTINKQPSGAKEVRRNIEQVANCLIRNGIQAGRKLLRADTSYSNYLSLIWQAKIEYQERDRLHKQRHPLSKQPKRGVTEQEMETLTSWLNSRGIECSSTLSAQSMAQLCGQILQLRLYRQTTSKIKASNMTKILEELRRLGWEGRARVEEVLGEQGEGWRWEMAAFVRLLVERKVYYCRS